MLANKERKVKVEIELTPELFSALTLKALEDRTSVSEEIERKLRENPEIIKLIAEIEREPDAFVPKKNAEK